ncbi:hypothetical protein [Actinoallomurus sp. NPDC050550]|uniref:hypothetical protein n=1 Tax=Actinoallomurus sp. NPDC050550 TaxID=3154937 RepID=UPI0033E72C9D
MAANKATYGAAIAIAALSLFLTGCKEGSVNAASSPTGTATPVHKSARAPVGKRVEAGVKCTDRINYSGDSRSNAEINSIGERTGHCPPVQRGKTPPCTPEKAGTKCTDQINYSGDSRSNAEINSIGARTGYCPPVHHR